MTARRRIAFSVVGSVLVLACARSVPPEYARARAAAERAYAAGRYLEAAGEWQRAADTAARRRDRDEARYRKAVSLERAGRSEAARSEYERLGRSDTERAARALLDMALLALEDGDHRTAERRLDELIRKHPESGLAPRALALRLSEIRLTGDEARVQQFLEETLQRRTHRDLEQHVHYAYADSLERQEKLVAALDRYLLVAKRYGYPSGSLWDDAIWRAADIEARRNHATRAVALLQGMLAHRESAFLVGSYERPRYADAQYRIAELYRDALKNPNRARIEFQRLFREFPKSRLRDDAKWQEAVLAHAQGDRSAACEAAEELVVSLPESRFAPCSKLVCPGLRLDVNRGRCRDYIRREVDSRTSSTRTPVGR